MTHLNAREFLADFYLEKVNNFLTVERFAEYFNLEDEEAKVLLAMGAKYHEERAAFHKFLNEEIGNV